MKFSKEELKRVCERYNLGKLKCSKVLSHGLVNYNYDVVTEKGRFIIRILGNRMSQYNKKHIKVEFMVLNYLHDKNFPYHVPKPLKNKYGNYLSKFDEKFVWVYPRLEGENFHKVDTPKLKEMAKALATYHKFVSKIKVIPYKENHNWLLRHYDRIERVIPKNKLDRFVLKNLPFFRRMILKLDKISFNKNMLYAHQDFKNMNVLFKGNKLVAILDFGNISVKPRAKDISNCVASACMENAEINKQRLKIFLKEYEKILPLTKKEKTMIPYYVLMGKCCTFWWFYVEMKKRTSWKYTLMKRGLEKAKSIAQKYNLD